MHFMQSKKRKRRKKKSNKEFCAQHFKDWATIGRIIKVNGKELRVYTTAKLVEAFSAYGIPRTYQTINLWRKMVFYLKVLLLLIENLIIQEQ